MNKNEINEAFRQRTKKQSVEIIKFCKSLKYDYIDRIVINQLVKCSSAVAANYRAACRARSKAEFFSKLCIVVEEADETVFWFDVIKESGINDSETLKTLSQESLEILKIVAMARKNTQPSNHSVTQ
jgi:four helix bundle protein